MLGKAKRARADTEPLLHCTNPNPNPISHLPLKLIPALLLVPRVAKELVVPQGQGGAQGGNQASTQVRLFYRPEGGGV